MLRWFPSLLHIEYREDFCLGALMTHAMIDLAQATCNSFLAPQVFKVATLQRRGCCQFHMHNLAFPVEGPVVWSGLACSMELKSVSICTFCLSWNWKHLSE